MLRIIYSLLLCLPVTAFSQEYFTKTKAEVKKELEQYAAANQPLSPFLQETDSTLVLSVKEQSMPIRTIYGFDKASGQCNYQKTVTSCDSCFQRSLTKMLAQKQYDWRKINENQYVSKYADQLLLELSVDQKEYYFTLFRAEWTKELYDLLLKN